MPAPDRVYYEGECDGCGRTVRTWRRPSGETPPAEISVFCARCDGAGDLRGRTVAARKVDPETVAGRRAITDGGTSAGITGRTPFDGCPECGGSLGCPSQSDRICQDCGEEFCHETRGDRHLLWSFDDDYQLNEVVARAK